MQARTILQGPRAKITASVIVILAIGVALLLSSSGGQTRSVKAYCGTLRQTEASTRSQFLQLVAQRNAWADLGALLAAPSQLTSLLTTLDGEAPPAIEPSISTVNSAFSSEVAAWDANRHDPIKFLFLSAKIAATASLAVHNVSQWTTANCAL